MDEEQRHVTGKRYSISRGGDGWRGKRGEENGKEKKRKQEEGKIR